MFQFGGLGALSGGLSPQNPPRGDGTGWSPGQEASLATPCLNLRFFFRKQMYCIEESACDIVGTFWRPHNHSAPPAVFQRPRVIRRPWNCAPLAPLVTPLLIEP